MQTKGRVFDDMARVAGGAAGVVTGLRAEIEALVRGRVERLMGQFDLVPREEFEAVKELAATARREQETLAKRVAALEAQLGLAAPKAARRTPAKKAAAGKAPRKAARAARK
ncbi:MAG: accessory factor UbiK family protein [Alphaproteobacteria bacterium]